MSTYKNRFQEKTTPFIREIAGGSDAIKKMYFFDPELEDIPSDTGRDLFFEKKLSKTKGLVYKYRARALVLLSYTCAANCRYCERQDRVGVGLDSLGRLKDSDIDEAVNLIRQTVDIREIIFSGGDPLTHPKGLLRSCELLAEVQHVKILRIHSRFPLQLPGKMDFELMEKIVNVPQTFYFSLHIDHPDELTSETISVIQHLRKLGFIMLCQTVFLKGINDDVEILKSLFNQLADLGVRPYYIYHCQPIPTTMRFVMNIEDEINIISKLRENLSGLAFPQHVLELQHTTGKVIVPTNHWNVDLDEVKDFNGHAHNIADRALRIQAAPTNSEISSGILDI